MTSFLPAFDSLSPGVVAPVPKPLAEVRELIDDELVVDSGEEGLLEEFRLPTPPSPFKPSPELLLLLLLTWELKCKL